MPVPTVTGIRRSNFLVYFFNFWSLDVRDKGAFIIFFSTVRREALV